MPQAALSDINYYVVPSLLDPYQELARLNDVTPGEYKIAVIGNLHVGVIGCDDRNAIEWLKNHYQAVREAFVANEEQIGRDLSQLANNFAHVEPDVEHHLVSTYVTRRLNTLASGAIFHFQMQDQFAIAQR